MRRKRRSFIAFVIEECMRTLHVKHAFVDLDHCKKVIEIRRIKNRKEYMIPSQVRFSIPVQDEVFDDMKIFYLNRLQEPKKIILYVHGGAYIKRPMIYHWTFLNAIAERTGAEIIVPIYPLAPEHSYREAYKKIFNLYHSITRKYNDSKIILMGDSAGGGFCAGFCEYLVSKKMIRPDLLILLSPWLDITMRNPKIKNYEDSDPMLSSRGLIEMGEFWAGDTDCGDYKLSPIYGNVHNFCKTEIFIGTREILYPDAKLFYLKLKNAGIDTHIHIANQMNHDYALYPTPEGNKAVKTICSMIDKM